MWSMPSKQSPGRFTTLWNVRSDRSDASVPLPAAGRAVDFTSVGTIVTPRAAEQAKSGQGWQVSTTPVFPAELQVGCSGHGCEISSAVLRPATWSPFAWTCPFEISTPAHDHRTKNPHDFLLQAAQRARRTSTGINPLSLVTVVSAVAAAAQRTGNGSGLASAGVLRAGWY